MKHAHFGSGALLKNVLDRKTIKTVQQSYFHFITHLHICISNYGVYQGNQ